MVRQKTWSNVEVSAYLDGELDATTQNAFEAAMAQDGALRQQVNELREVVAVLRAAPLREPPRNYLLTAGMVTETYTQSAKRRRTPLLMMRLATSVAAAAFVVTMGLGFINQRVSPTMVTQPEAASYMVEVADTQAVEIAAEEPIVLEAELPEKSAEKVMTQKDEVAFAPLPDEGAAVGGIGVGGGGESEMPEAAPMMAEAAPGAETESIDASAEAAPNAAVPEEEVPPNEERALENTAEVTETVSLEPMPIAVDEEDLGSEISVWRREFPPTWLPAALGVSTLLLAGITIWMSRKR